MNVVGKINTMQEYDNVSEYYLGTYLYDISIGGWKRLNGTTTPTHLKEYNEIPYIIYGREMKSLLYNSIDTDELIEICGLKIHSFHRVNSDIFLDEITEFFNKKFIPTDDEKDAINLFSLMSVI